MISAEGDHDPKWLYYVAVDAHGMLVDLSGVTGALHDPTMARVEWGPVLVNGEVKEGGVIVYKAGGITRFADKAALKPYLDAFEARKAKLLPKIDETAAKTEA